METAPLKPSQVHLGVLLVLEDCVNMKIEEKKKGVITICIPNSRMSFLCLTAAVAFVVCLGGFAVQQAKAVDPFPAGAYPVGWYDSSCVPGDPTGIASHGGNVSMAYWGGCDAATRNAYLYYAAEAGIRVILEIDAALIAAGDVAGIRDAVRTYDDHPAVVGWYTYDEPDPAVIPLSMLQTAYDAIKLESSKPVTICIAGPSTGSPVIYKTAYDILFVDSYPSRIGEAEFSGLDSARGQLNTANAQAQLAERPWWSLMQGWSSDVGTDTFRLPTYNESRFMNYYSLSEDAAGLLHFAYYRTGNTWGSPAYPDEPYPYDGRQWLDDVWEPLAGQANMLGPALQNGKVPGAVSSDAFDVRGSVYQDPDTGKHYLLTLNETTGSETSTFTLNLNPPGQKYISAIPLFEGARPAIPIIAAQFSEVFSQFEVHVYELTTMLLGDANGDGVVSADDYSSVQSNFGNTGVPGSPGDANGTATVSADDYASVQSHFGATTGMGSVPVPEPTTFGLLGMGLIAILRKRK